MGVNSTLYNLVFVLHLVAVVVGFGSMFMNGAYGAQARRRRGPGGQAIGEATLAVTKMAQYAVYSVPVFGILLIVLSDGVWEFSHMWISLSFLLYFVAVGLVHGLVFPAAKRMNDLVGASGGTGEVAQMEALEKRVALGGMIVNLLVVVTIALMVFKPGV
ncbi:MAG: DUF2269 domain-containing protein [Actinobacteria bacterium]|nr:DUF2269 domain-containing protein [Actinomycetota bacterium]MBW3649172.1 DUF2269 domain-containing protein [Actinomycetota bacterium]